MNQRVRDEIGEITLPESMDTQALLRVIVLMPYETRYNFYVPKGKGQRYKDRLHVGLSRIKKELATLTLPKGATPKRFRMKSEIVESHPIHGDLLSFWMIQTERNTTFESLDKAYLAATDKTEDTGEST